MAFASLRCPKSMQLIPGASHLFEEPGALETVRSLASDWFTEHLRQHPGSLAEHRL
jgi:putative phosphoribosyl transferase